MPLVTAAQLIAHVNQGQVVSFPTDTVPALAAKPDAAPLIYQLKRRSPDKPLILMTAALPEVWDYVVGSEAEKEHWQAIAQQYWPGALTLVLPASEKVSAAMNPTNSGTIGVRVPDLDLAQAILRETGPLATTSANRSGSDPLEWMGAIASEFTEIGVLDCTAQEQMGKIGSGQPSTVAQWTGKGWQILRQGSLVLSPQP
ncbi:L-threonylcarbamoyladenylate synthase [Picosynechococcus sp. NKBG15041c]|uniref:L-threonylcarbamoyladenylate synthase n=1 Tax=Picosynechococcus sp. NKBG15041c TaxID=1407650 RepID=UPI0004299B2F|nr:L-threonylcarbamoyladenylate synthase [Picosynechococcus sp. NKBG15041c]